jgi:2-polyprenyl-3-methyl-5-hydroxy-6-metoxy-1,4-benzoquinol methylase
MSAPAPSDQPNPAFIFETLNSYQRTAALRAAIQLDVFTVIGQGHNSPAQIAAECRVKERGARILCDYLSIIGLLAKRDGRYSLSRDAAVFLDRRSAAYIGSIAKFLAKDDTVDIFMDLADIVRDPAASLSGRTAMEPENPLWVEFARSMAPLMALPAEAIAEIVGAGSGENWRVLDVAAGHGLFGIAIAKRNPNAQIFALDWPSVLEVARDNAQGAGVGARHHLLPGSVFDRDLGSGYNLVLLTNFLHHFDISTNVALLRKVRPALAPGGRVATLDFVPNEDRVTPPLSAAFSMTMLGHTTGGDAYTFAEYDHMFRSAGFSSIELHPLPGPMSLLITHY